MGMREEAKADLVGYGTKCPARKGAHVQQVNRCERVWRNIFMREGERRPKSLRVLDFIGSR
jgi:hypothetical protein